MTFTHKSKLLSISFMMLKLLVGFGSLSTLKVSSWDDVFPHAYKMTTRLLPQPMQDKSQQLPLTFWMCVWKIFLYNSIVQFVHNTRYMEWNSYGENLSHPKLLIYIYIYKRCSNDGACGHHALMTTWCWEGILKFRYYILLNLVAKRLWEG
jgi:hypothetical protein